MKKSKFLFIAIFSMVLFTCKDDDCHITYKNQEVDFYTSHKKYKIQPALFDTIEETVLSVEAHLEGAVFETVTEQILIRESFSRYKIMDSVSVRIVKNAETNDTSEFFCYHFYDDSEISSLQVPAQYTTRTSQRVIQQGTGAEVPATFSTITKIILDTNTELIEHTEEQSFNRVEFRIPEARTIRGHLDYYFERQSIESCMEGNSYKIQE